MQNGVVLLVVVCFAAVTNCSAEQCPPSVHEDPPIVCTFFEPFEFHAPELADDYLKILKIWDVSWRRHGWRTLILTRKDAELHPRYKDVSFALENLPTINDKIYELSCYLRWLAAVQAGCGPYPHPTPIECFNNGYSDIFVTMFCTLVAGWMSDIDMINYGFPAQKRWSGPQLFSFNGFVPSLVTGSSESFEAIIDAFMQVSGNITEGVRTNAVWQMEDRRLFTSDMLILKSRPDLYLDLKFPSSILGDYVNRTMLLHFDKAEVKKWAKILGIEPLKHQVLQIVRNIN
jgi:hypothetical protein